MCRMGDVETKRRRNDREDMEMLGRDYWGAPLSSRVSVKRVEGAKHAYNHNQRLPWTISTADVHNSVVQRCRIDCHLKVIRRKKKGKLDPPARLSSSFSGQGSNDSAWPWQRTWGGDVQSF